MILNSNKLDVSVITKPAPQLSPLWPPKYLFIKCGINIAEITPDKRQYSNNKVLVSKSPKLSRSLNDKNSTIKNTILYDDKIISYDHSNVQLQGLI